MTKHIPHFEALRGIAALWVFASHVLLITDLKIRHLTSGDQAVEVFVILSGFVIALMQINEREPYHRYIFRRFMRLYPLFVIAMVYGLATDHLYDPVFGSSPWLSQARVAFQTREANLAGWFWEHLLLHLTMLHGALPDTLLPQAPLMFSGPLWSISLEWQFYLIAPPLIALITFSTRRGAVISLLVLALAVMLERFTQRVWVGEVTSFLPLRLPLFIVGIMSAALWRNALHASVGKLAVGVAAGFLASCAVSPHKLPLILWFGTYFVAAAYKKLTITRSADRIVSSRGPRFLGEVSYGLYVLHVPTMMLVSCYIVFPLLGGASKAAGAIAITTLTLPTALGLAYLSYRYIERPASTWARRFRWGAKQTAEQGNPQGAPTSQAS